MPSAAGGVQVGADLLGERRRRLLAAASPWRALACPARQRVEPRQEIGDPLERFFGLRQRAHENFSCLR